MGQSQERKSQNQKPDRAQAGQDAQKQRTQQEGQRAQNDAGDENLSDTDEDQPAAGLQQGQRKGKQSQKR
jgi:hypothetical protein